MPKGVSDSSTTSALKDIYFKFMKNRLVNLKNWKKKLSTDGIFECRVKGLTFQLKNSFPVIGVRIEVKGSKNHLMESKLIIERNSIDYQITPRRYKTEKRPDGNYFFGRLIYILPSKFKKLKYRDEFHFVYGGLEFNRVEILVLNHENIDVNKLRLFIDDEEPPYIGMLFQKQSPGRCKVCGKSIRGHRRLGGRLFHPNVRLKKLGEDYLEKIEKL